MDDGPSGSHPRSDVAEASARRRRVTTNGLVKCRVTSQNSGRSTCPRRSYWTGSITGRHSTLSPRATIRRCARRVGGIAPLHRRNRTGLRQTCRALDGLATVLPAVGRGQPLSGLVQTRPTADWGCRPRDVARWQLGDQLRDPGFGRSGERA